LCKGFESESDGERFNVSLGYDNIGNFDRLFMSLLGITGLFKESSLDTISGKLAYVLLSEVAVLSMVRLALQSSSAFEDGGGGVFSTSTLLVGKGGMLFDDVRDDVELVELVFCERCRLRYSLYESVQIFRIGNTINTRPWRGLWSTTQRFNSTRYN